MPFLQRRHSILLIVWALWGVAAVPTAWAQLQTGTIRGKVADESVQPVPGVTVTLRDARRGTERVATTDLNGTFQFLAVPAGNDYELVAELSGFQRTVVSAITVNAGFTQEFNLSLKVASLEETVTVVAEKPLVDTTTTQESTTINSEFIENLPLISRNYTEVAPQLPGVSWNRGGRFTFYQFNIHGAEIWGNGYRVDGASTMFSSNRTGFLLVPSAIEQMEIMAGGIPAEYGEQYGGVIKITTKTGTNQVSGFGKTLWRPNALYSNQDTGLSTQVLEKPPGSTQIQELAIGGPIQRDRLWHFGAFQWIDEEQGSVITRADPLKLDFFSFHEKLTFQQAQNRRWDLSISGSPHWARRRPPEITTDREAKFTQHTPGMNFGHLLYTHVLNDRNFMEQSLSFYHLELFSQTDRGRENVRPDEIRLQAWNPALGLLYNTGPSPTYSRTFNLRSRYSTRFLRNTPSHTMKLGIDYGEQFGTNFSERYVKTIQDLRGRPGGGPVILTANTRAEESLRNTTIGLYGQDSWSVGRATLDYGLRYDRESVVGRNNFAPRLGFGMDPTGSGNMKVFANFGVLYSSLNSAFYTFVSEGLQGAATYTVLNPDANYNGTLVLRSRTFRRQDEIKNPYVVSYSAGIERELFFDTKLSVAYHHRDTYDNFKGTNERLSPTDVVQIYRNDGESKYDGVEFVVRKYMTQNFDLLAHYTLAKSEGDTTDILSPLQQQFQFGPQEWDQRHTYVMSGNARLPWNVRFTGLFRYASGRPYSITNDLPGVEAAWLDRNNNPVNRNNERQPANKTFDLNMGRSFETRHGSFTPTLEIINAFNWVNVIGVSTSRSSPGTAVNVDTGRLMQIGLEWKF
jgi:hypothetical protein